MRLGPHTLKFFPSKLIFLPLDGVSVGIGYFDLNAGPLRGGSFCQIILQKGVPFPNGTAHLKKCKQRNSAFFAFSLIIEGTTEKVLKFIMPLKLIYNRNFGFIVQKMYF
jgi:hypothetical protein